MRVVELTEDLSTAPATQLQISHNRCAHLRSVPMLWQNHMHPAKHWLIVDVSISFWKAFAEAS